MVGSNLWRIWMVETLGKLSWQADIQRTWATKMSWLHTRRGRCCLRTAAFFLLSWRMVGYFHPHQVHFQCETLPFRAGGEGWIGKRWKHWKVWSYLSADLGRYAGCWYKSMINTCYWYLLNLFSILQSLRVTSIHHIRKGNNSKTKWLCLWHTRIRCDRLIGYSVVWWY